MNKTMRGTLRFTASREAAESALLSFMRKSDMRIQYTMHLPSLELFKVSSIASKSCWWGVYASAVAPFSLDATLRGANCSGAERGRLVAFMSTTEFESERECFGMSTGEYSRMVELVKGWRVRARTDIRIAGVRDLRLFETPHPDLALHIPKGIGPLRHSYRRPLCCISLLPFSFFALLCLDYFDIQRECENCRNAGELVELLPGFMHSREDDHFSTL